MQRKLTLTSDKRCAACGELMAAGSPFRWMEKRVRSSGRVSDAGRPVYVPAHVGPCVLEKFESHVRDVRRRAFVETERVLRAAGVPEADIEACRPPAA